MFHIDLLFDFLRHHIIYVSFSGALFNIIWAHNHDVVNAKEGLLLSSFLPVCVCMTRYLMYCVNAAFNHGQGDIASNTRRFEIFSEYVYNTRLLFGTHKDTHE